SGQLGRCTGSGRIRGGMGNAREGPYDNYSDHETHERFPLHRRSFSYTCRDGGEREWYEKTAKNGCHSNITGEEKARKIVGTEDVRSEGSLLQNFLLSLWQRSASVREETDARKSATPSTISALVGLGRVLVHQAGIFELLGLPVGRVDELWRFFDN